MSGVCDRRSAAWCLSWRLRRGREPGPTCLSGLVKTRGRVGRPQWSLNTWDAVRRRQRGHAAHLSLESAELEGESLILNPLKRRVGAAIICGFGQSCAPSRIQALAPVRMALEGQDESCLTFGCDHLPHRRHPTCECA